MSHAHRYKRFAYAVVALTTGIMVVLAWNGIAPAPVAHVLFWAALLTVVDLLPVTLGFGTQVTMAMPIHIAIAVTFDPWLSMAIAGAASIDLREIKREIPLHRALFNRSQIMLSMGAAAGLFAVASRLGVDPFALPAGPVAVAVAAVMHLLANLTLVSLAVHYEQGLPALRVLRDLPPRPVSGFVLSYLLLTALALVTAFAFREIGAWAVAAIIIPILFARLSILGARAQQELGERVRKQQEALLAVTEALFRERESERKRIAEDIHDSALQMMAATTYACGNAIDFLRSGKRDRALEALETAGRAADGAIAALRDSLVDLRRSSLEEGGLMETISNYAGQIATLWDANIDVEGELSQEPPVSVGVVAFQILQEGVVNALKHSNSDGIAVKIHDAEGEVRIIVEDDGVGFDPEGSFDGHMGMELMRERAERVGGRVEIESVPGSGTRLTAHLPAVVGS